MKKQDLIIIAVLFALLMAWPFFYKRWIEPHVATPANSAAKTNLASRPAAIPDVAAPAAAPSPAASGASKTPVESEPTLGAVNESAPAGAPEQLVTLTNAGLAIAVSSRGGGLVSATFNSYRDSVAKNSGPVALDFSQMPALSYQGLNDFTAQDNFTVTAAGPDAITIAAVASNGLQFARTLELDGPYQVVVRDTFSNATATSLSIPKHVIRLGPMRLPAGDYRMSGMDYLGIDALASSGGEGVIHWAGKLAKLFKTYMKEKQMAFPPQTIIQQEDTAVDWIAVKNKFFVQILVPENGATGYSLIAGRVSVKGEDENPALSPKSAELKDVSAAIRLPEKLLEPGQAYSQNFKLYLGPKKYSILRALGLHQEDVMEFGLWSPVCKFLLTVLNLTYSAIPNYGIAIIVLTVLIRIIFWPLTHKSTESMKKMQTLQPLMSEIRAKYKDSPKKMQEETMALYRKNKINPVSGCLPMLIQIPVFIALFIVLRSAIELRFAPFLWINDLSAPERLFADLLPIPLNILPIFMAASQAWQQALMPATDPNQQKMMLFFMPVMMLVMFYMMPSALVLYWSANQCIMIAQQLIQKKRSAARADAKKI